MNDRNTKYVIRDTKVTHIEDLDVFMVARSFVKTIYNTTKSFPKDELFGLVSQMRRASTSICCNLAEGGGRITDGEQKHFIGMARGSAAELKCQIMIAYDLEFIDKIKFDELIKEVIRINQMLTGLLKKA